MLRPTFTRQAPICPMCGQPGVHGGNVDACLSALRTTIANGKAQMPRTAAPEDSQPHPLSVLLLLATRVALERRTPPMPAYPLKWLSINQSAALVGVTRECIGNWIRRKRVRYRRTAGYCVRIWAPSLLR